MNEQLLAEERAARIPVTPCPSWCELGPNHIWELDQFGLDDPATRMHKRSTRFRGATLVCLEERGEGQPVSVVEVAMDEDLTPGQARRLAAELLRVADLADNVPVVQSVVDGWRAPPWATLRQA